MIFSRCARVLAACCAAAMLFACDTVSRDNPASASTFARLMRCGTRH